MQLKPNQFFILLVVALFCCSCSSVDVHIEYADDVDFSSYHTYAWDSSTPDTEKNSFGHEVVNPDLDRRIKESIDLELSRKGFSRATSAGAKLLMSLHERVKQEMEDSGGPSVEAFQEDYVSPTGAVDIEVSGVGVAGPSRESVERGMLILKMRETKSKRVIWTGTAESLVNEDTSSDREIVRFVSHLLGEFPPK